MNAIPLTDAAELRPAAERTLLVRTFLALGLVGAVGAPVYMNSSPKDTAYVIRHSEALGVLCRKSLRLHLMFTIGVAVFATFQARQVLTHLDAGHGCGNRLEFAPNVVGRIGLHVEAVVLRKTARQENEDARRLAAVLEDTATHRGWAPAP